MYTQNPSRFRRPSKPPKNAQGALFSQLDATQQAAAIARLKRSGLTDAAISDLTGALMQQIIEVKLRRPSA